MPHSALASLPVYSAIKIPSFQSVGIRPDLHTLMNSACRASATGPTAPLSNSGGMPSGPAARPFLSFDMAPMTSARVGSSIEVFILGSAVALAASASRAAEGGL